MDVIIKRLEKVVSVYTFTICILLAYGLIYLLFKETLKDLFYSIDFVVFVACFFIPFSLISVIRHVGKVAEAKNKPKLIWQMCALMIPVLGPIIVSRLLIKS